MKSSVVENKEIRNLFKLKREIDDTTFKHIRYFFRMKKVNESIKDRIFIGIMNLSSMKKKIIIN